MKIYKRQMKIQHVCPGGQGFCDDIRDLTGWLDEDAGETALAEFKERCSSLEWYGHIAYKERYVQIDRYPW